MPEIIILPEARELGLPVTLADLIRQNIEKRPEKIKPFESLEAKVLIEIPDIQTSAGLEFHRGKLTLSKDLSGKPDLHILTDSTTILDLSLLKIKLGLPYFFDNNGFKILKKILSGEIIIKGLLKKLLCPNQPDQSHFHLLNSKRSHRDLPLSLVKYHYAKMIMAITGITRIRVLITHQIEFLSFRTLPFAPMITVTNAARPLIKAISIAMSPRIKHPNTSTGVKATTKKRTGMRVGRMT